MNFANERAIFCVKNVAQQKQKFAYLSQKIAKKFCNWNPYLDNGWLNEELEYSFAKLCTSFAIFKIVAL